MVFAVDISTFSLAIIQGSISDRYTVLWSLNWASTFLRMFCQQRWDHLNATNWNQRKRYQQCLRLRLHFFQKKCCDFCYWFIECVPVNDFIVNHDVYKLTSTRITWAHYCHNYRTYLISAPSCCKRLFKERTIHVLSYPFCVFFFFDPLVKMRAID